MPSNHQQDGMNREHGREKGNNPAAVRSISSSLGFGTMQEKSKQQVLYCGRVTILSNIFLSVYFFLLTHFLKTYRSKKLVEYG